MKEIIKLRLDPETREKLYWLAAATGQSPATLVSEAVRRFVELELATLAAAGGELPENDNGEATTSSRLKLIV